MNLYPIAPNGLTVEVFCFMSGWIKIHRRLTEWEWYTDVNTFKLFMHLLLKANHKDNSHRGQLVKRGQLITGRYKLSGETGLSERQVRTALDKLLATNEVTSKTTNKNSLITILNYDLYQNSESERPTERPAKSPTNDQPPVHKQEVKNEKKKEDKDIKARQLAFKNSLWNKFKNDYNAKTIEAFYLYWTEHGDDDKKMRFEKEKSFSVSLRLKNWAKNNFDKTEPTKQFTNNAHLFQA